LTTNRFSSLSLSLEHIAFGYTNLRKSGIFAFNYKRKKPTEQVTDESHSNSTLKLCPYVLKVVRNRYVRALATLIKSGDAFSFLYSGIKKYIYKKKAE